jgi:hypothetical protein
MIYTKNEVHYTDDHGTSSEQCSKCRHYDAPARCDIVEGKIKPGGWCNRFKRAVTTVPS